MSRGSRTGGQAGRDGPGTGAGHLALAREWARQVAGTSYVPLSPTEIERLLAGFVGRLHDALLAEPFTTAPGYEVGRALAEAHFTGSPTLARTLVALDDNLLTGLGLPVDTPTRSRLAELRAEIATGHTDVLRARILEEQQSISQAAFVARDEATRAQRLSEARFRALYAGAAVGIAIADIGGRILHGNQALQTMLGYDLDELRQQDVTSFIHPDDVAEWWEAYDELVSGQRENVSVDKRLFRGDGVVLWTHLTVSLIRDDDGGQRSVVVMFEDVTDRHLLETRLRYLATHDPLTQLANRALLLESLDQVFADAADAVANGAAPQPGEAARLGLCFLDLDGFKVVNDSLGHAIGDRLLVEIASRLDKCVSTAGHLVARMGGDEFVILVASSTGPDQVVDIAGRVQSALSMPLMIDGHTLSVSASIGIVERQVLGTTPDDVLRAADITLYRAKAAGKGRWALYDPVHNAHEVARHTLSATMPAALMGGEFFIEFQPVIRLADGALIGVEAMVRWRHPKSGVLGPDRFMTLAEETGLIVPLGQWMLMSACEQLRMWELLYPSASLFVSVSLGSRHSQDPRLVDDVSHVLTETGLGPDRLQLALTRSAVMDAVDEPPRTLPVLAAKGVRIAIHDFWPGYSNFACLRGLPVHDLKIVGAFVRALRPTAPDPVDEQVVGTLISLAHALGLTVTAQDVGTPGQVARLRALGCDNGQGSFLARPGPPEQISKLLAATGSGNQPPSIVPYRW